MAGSQTFLCTVTQFSACRRPLLLLRPSRGSLGFLWNTPVDRKVSLSSSSEVSSGTVWPGVCPTENDPPLGEEPDLPLDPGSSELLVFGLLSLG